MGNYLTWSDWNHRDARSRWGRSLNSPETNRLTPTQRGVPSHACNRHTRIKRDIRIRMRRNWLGNCWRGHLHRTKWRSQLDCWLVNGTLGHFEITTFRVFLEGAWSWWKRIIIKFVGRWRWKPWIMHTFARKTKDLRQRSFNTEWPWSCNLSFSESRNRFQS